MYIFDLDGTLIDTHEAVKAAYQKVGVNMPDDAWGKPWHHWVSAHSHAKKSGVYEMCLQEYADVMPLFRYAQKSKSHVITGASRTSVAIICKLFGELNVQLCSASTDRKIDWLLDADEGITYVDDLVNVRRKIRRSVGCKVMSPKTAFRALSQQQGLTPALRETLLHF